MRSNMRITIEREISHQKNCNNSKTAGMKKTANPMISPDIIHPQIHGVDIDKKTRYVNMIRNIKEKIARNEVISDEESLILSNHLCNIECPADIKEKFPTVTRSKQATIRKYETESYERLRENEFNNNED